MTDLDRIREDVLKWPCTQVQEMQMSLMERAPLFDIEVSSICNQECVFCPRGTIVRENSFLDPELFEVLYEWLPDDAVVMFSGLGECLLNRNLGLYVKKLKDRGISSCIITNGVLLTPERQEELIGSGIDQFQISYMTCDRSSYDEITGRKGDFKSLNLNLQHLAETRPAGLRVQLNFLDLGFNHDEIHAIKGIALKWGFDFFYRRKHSRGGALFIPEFRQEDRRTCFRCGTFASGYFIASDGNILSCSNDTGSSNLLGNIASSDYASVAKNKSVILLDRAGFNICKKCTDDYRWYTLWNCSHEKSITMRDG